MKKIKAGIIGGAGYTGGELIRILLNHPDVEIAFVQSKSNAGNPLHAVHTDLYGETDLVFGVDPEMDIDVLFLCLGHGESRKFIERHPVNPTLKIIDLSQDFRWNGIDFTYGLPELQRDKIQSAANIANPGCFATAIQLSLLPLAKEKLLNSDIHVSGITGSTGAGKSLSDTSHFSWRNNNISTYKVFEHQHLIEAEKSLKTFQAKVPEILFVPYRGNFSRGILTTTYTKTDLNLDAIEALYNEYFESHPFVKIVNQSLDLKQVVNTNKCVINLARFGNQLVVTAAIDNLLKGASGQAVQNMNLMFGLEETTGLKFKSIAF
jgi:N-acetyl-gamma-glutamyl-phosphate reductase